LHGTTHSPNANESCLKNSRKQCPEVVNQNNDHRSTHIALAGVGHDFFVAINEQNYSDCLNQGSWQVEIQVVGKSVPVNVWLVVENFPVWLVGLEPSTIQMLHILGFASQKQLNKHLISKQLPVVLANQLLQRFGARRVRFMSSSTCTTGDRLTLVSGLLRYVDSYVGSRSATEVNLTIGAVDHHYHGQIRNG
jgi:hypothetical protein